MNVVKKFVGRKRDEASANSRISKRGGHCYRPSKLVTSTIFDNDDIFSAVANALIYKHEEEELSVRDAINATIFTSTEREAFLESIDLRNANMYLHQDEELENATPVGELAKKVRTIFSPELQSMWRESTLEREGVFENTDQYYEKPSAESGGGNIPTPLKTPKNLHLSPVQTSVSKGNVLSAKSSGRQRRRSFFPDTSDHARCRARIRIDFKLRNAADAQPVSSLQLDGFSNPEPLREYIPPSSPLCSVSN
ncbi:unnamed protein product [Cylindrotheca closterium]|uniref:Uncharacterized protein n=1 Tax=Cylindrotheca closterium TaxID=2856 RepID=A0AAD2CDK6_9STRA|nr:unnamed protein product [Cylindrotheca closterium]